ncbi:MAG: hypothetical protein HKN79_03935 [Flavobacteriales bacterium]|nr:hypothetical protein [Flavobacteriales bacterium]
MFEILKRVYRCDPLPWTLLYVAVILLLTSHFLIWPLSCSEGIAGLFGPLPILSRHPYGTLLSIAIVILIPFRARSLLDSTGILDYQNRSSLYPLALFSATALLSCQSLSWLIVLILLLLLYAQVIGLKEGDSLAAAAFKAGLIISLCSLLSPIMFGLLLFVWPGFSILRTLNWKCIIWTLVGIALPLYLYTSLQYIITGQLVMYEYDHMFLTETSTGSSGSGLLTTIYIFVQLSVSSLLLIRTIRQTRKGIVRKRKILRISILLLGVTLLLSLALFQLADARPGLVLMGLPLSFLFLELLKSDASRVDSLLFMVWLITTFVFLWI